MSKELSGQETIGALVKILAIVLVLRAFAWDWIPAIIVATLGLWLVSTVKMLATAIGFLVLATVFLIVPAGLSYARDLCHTSDGGFSCAANAGDFAGELGCHTSDDGFTCDGKAADFTGDLSFHTSTDKLSRWHLLFDLEGDPKVL